MNNRKGFTLVELLAVIVVIGLVIGIAIYGVTNIFDTSKSKTVVLDKSGILSSAKIYSTEQSDSNWKEDNKNKYLCVTIEELQNKGFINKNASLGNLDKSNYVKFTKDKVTLVSDNGVIVENNNDVETDDICTGNVTKEKVDIYPKLKEGTSSTDTLVIGYTDGTAESNITSTNCYYGTSSGDLDNEGTVNNNECTINGLENNSTYYVKVCQTTEKGSIMCTDTESRTTKDFINTDITPNTSSVTITYHNENISGDAGYYFKSSINIKGTTTSNIYGCELNNNIFTCDDASTTTIESDKWYKTDLDEIVINYNRTISGEITTRITDKSNNFKEDSEHVDLYGIATIRFSPNDGNVQESSTYTDGNVYKWSTDTNGYITRTAANGNEYVLYTKKYIDTKTNDDLPDYNYSKYLNITKTGYTASLGSEWKCLSGCTTSNKTFDQDASYSATDFCDAGEGNCNVVLGVNWKANKYTISYNLDGGTNYSGAPTSYTYGKGATINGTPTRDGYTFKGWCTTSAKTSCSTTKTISKTATGAKTYYAKWIDDIAPKLEVNLSTSTTWCSGKKLILTCDDSGSGMYEAKIVDKGTTTTGTTTTSQKLISTREGDVATIVTCTDNSGNVSTSTYYYNVVNSTDTYTKAYDTCPNNFSPYTKYKDYKCRKSASCSKYCASITSSSTCNSYSNCKWYTYSTALSGTSFCKKTGYASATAAAAGSDACAKYSCSSGTLSGAYCYSYYTKCSSGWTNSGTNCTKTQSNTCS